MTTINSGFSDILTILVGEKIRLEITGSVDVTLDGVITTLTNTVKDFGKYTSNKRLHINNVRGSVVWNRVQDVRNDDAIGVVSVAASRTLTQADNGSTLDCAASVVLTIPPGLSNFGCAVRPAGVQIACGAGVTINGAGSILTTTGRVGAINPSGTSNAYDVVGA